MLARIWFLCKAYHQPAFFTAEVNVPPECVHCEVKVRRSKFHITASLQIPMDDVPIVDVQHPWQLKMHSQCNQTDDNHQWVSLGETW